VLLPAILTWTVPAHAHVPGESLPWDLDPWVLLPLAASLALYIAGTSRLWARAGRWRGIGRVETGCFVAGWTILAIALLSPVDTLGVVLFSAHMVQHEMMMVVAAPLLVLSRPLEAMTWGLSPTWRGAVARLFRARPLAATFRALTDPAGAFAFHAAALWIWHLPALFDVALRNDAVHTLQHATFLASALAFWWSVVRANHAVALASVFATLLHTGALGALLTFAPYALYPSYHGGHGITALEDQQLGGLVMWVPGGLAYLAVSLTLAWRLLSAPDSRSSPGATFDAGSRAPR
jgi:putative membrane protein